MTLAHGEDEWQTIKYPGLGIEIRAALNRPMREITDNVRINCKRGLPQVWPCEPKTKDGDLNTQVLAICAGGPSLAESIDKIKESKRNGAKVVALAGAAKYLIKNGVVPTAHVLLDSRVGNVGFISDIDCQYFVASQCDPAVFDALKDRRVMIWHAINGDKDVEAIEESYEKWVPVAGGNTIALRSLRLFQILGYHRFELFGFDSCILNGKHHAYKQEAADETETKDIMFNKKKFTVTAWQIQQAMEFQKMVKTFGQDWEIICHGDGLIAEMIKGA